MGQGFSRRSFARLAAGAAFAGTGWIKALGAWQAQAAANHGHVIFPFGTHVYREPHLPLEQLRHDFGVLKQLGFTMIKIQEVWANDEPREGAIDLSNVSRVVSDARQNGLRVYFGVTMENAPAWLWKKYPDANMVYETGEAHNDPTPYVLPADGKPGPCWDHPGARAAAIRFIETVGKEIGKYNNIEVWNVWQEIGFWPERAGHLGFCFCKYTLPEFRKWLQARYKSLEELNEAWKSAYGDWEEVEPPRFSPQVPPTIDWRYFMDDVYLTKVLQWKGDAFRRSDPLHRPILAHVSSPEIGSTAAWRYGEVLDIFGSSCYPAWGGFEKWDAGAPAAGKPVPKFNGLYHELWENVLMKYDYVRSTKPNGNIWNAELQGGPITEGLNRRRVPDAADIRRWVLGCVSTGARGICFWNHRPEIFWQEGYGFSLLDWGSDSTPRAEEAGRVARALNANAELFARGEHPPPAVALVMNEDLFHFARGSVSNVSEHLLYTIRGIWKMLWEEGIPAGFVEAQAIPADVSQYKAVILPFPIALGSKIIEALSAYTRSGGTVISEACPGRFSELGMGFEGDMAPGVAELFGVRSKRVTLIGEPNGGSKWTGTMRTYGDYLEYRDLAGKGSFTGFSVFPAYYLQTLAPRTAIPVLTWSDEVAGTVNSLGQGHAYLIGTLLGHATLAYGDRRNAAFVAAVLKRAGVLPDRVGKLNRRRRVLGNRHAWFLFNTTREAVEETVSLRGFRSVQDLFAGELPRAAGGVRLRVEPLDIRCLLLEA